MARRRRRRRLRTATRRRLRILLLVGGGLVLVVGLAAGWRILQAGQDLRAAERLLQDAGEAIENGRLAEGRLKLADATNRLTGAQGALHNHPELDVVRALPILGDNLVALRESVALAAQLSSGGGRILAAAQPLESPDGRLEVAMRDGRIPLDVVNLAQRETELLVASLPADDDLEDPGNLLGPVNDLHDKVIEEVRSRRAQLEVLAHGLAVLSEMSGGAGERLYLIAVANTAEMRGSGGMVLSYGELVGRSGKFDLLEFGRIDELFLDEPLDPAVVPDLPADYQRRWVGFDPLQLWRNATLAADFTLVAPVLEGMYGATRGFGPSGVIQIDPSGLAAILRGIGPVQVPPLGEVTADNLVPLVLHDAYVRYRGVEQRSDVLRDVAEAVFDKLVNGSFDSLRPLGAALAEAVDGRHILFKTASESLTDHIRAFGADGALPDREGPDSVHLTVQNVSGNKLDYFVDTEIALTGDRVPGQIGHVQAEVVVHNGAEPGVTEPKYIYGPWNDDQEVGVYRGVVSLYLPRGTTLVGASGDAPRDPPIAVSEDGRPVVGYTVDLPAGATHRVVLDLALPPRRDAAYELLGVPSPRVRPTVLRTDLDLGEGRRLVEEVELDRTWRLREGRRPQALQGTRQEEGSSAMGAYGMLAASWSRAWTPPRTRRDET